MGKNAIKLHTKHKKEKGHVKNYSNPNNACNSANSSTRLSASWFASVCGYVRCAIAGRWDLSGLFLLLILKLFQNKIKWNRPASVPMTPSRNHPREIKMHKNSPNLCPRSSDSKLSSSDWMGCWAEMTLWWGQQGWRWACMGGPHDALTVGPQASFLTSLSMGASSVQWI